MKNLYSILIGLLIGLILFLGTLLIFTALYKESIVKTIVAEINKQSDLEIGVSEVDFTILKKFPKATIELTQIYVKSDRYFPANVRGYQTDTLFEAGKLYLKVGIPELLQKKYVVQSIIIEGGSIRLFQLTNNSNNYKFLASRDASDDSKSLYADIENITVKNLKILIYSDQKGLTILGEIKRGEFKGKIDRSNFSLAVNAEAVINKLELKNKMFSKNLLVGCNFDFYYNDKEYRIENAIIRLQEKIYGELEMYFIPNQYLNLSSHIDHAAFKPLKNTVPVIKSIKVLSNLHDGSIGGSYQLEGEYYRDWRFQHILEFHLKNGVARFGKSHLSVDGIAMEGILDYENSKRYSINITRSEFYFANQLFKGNISVDASENIRFNVKGTQIDLQKVTETIDLDTLEFINGFANADIQYNGSLKNLSNPDFQNIFNGNYEIQIEIKDGKTKLKNSDVILEDISGKIEVDRSLHLKDLSLSAAQSNFLFNIQINKLASYLKGDDELTITGDIYSSRLVLEELITALNRSEKESKTEKFKLPERLKFNLRATILELGINNFQAGNLSGDFSYKPGTLSLNNLKFETMDGEASLKGTIEGKQGGEINFRNRSKIEGVQISQLFSSLNNFGQDYINDKHLQGILSGELFFSSTWDNTLKIIPETIIAESDIVIHEGELIDFEPMLGLSKYIDVNELKHIKFSTLENQIAIKDQTIIIPKMDIHSSAINIMASGNHHFNNQFEYHLTLAMSDILWRKAKRSLQNKNEFKSSEEEGEKTKLHLKIIGSPDDYKVSLDRARIREAFRENMQEEKKELKLIFNEEFGWFVDDEDVNRENVVDEKEFKIENDAEKKEKLIDTTKIFTIEWGEDTLQTQ